MTYQVGDRTRSSGRTWVVRGTGDQAHFLSVRGAWLDQVVIESGPDCTYFNSLRWAISTLKKVAKVRLVKIDPGDWLGPIRHYEDK